MAATTEVAAAVASGDLEAVQDLISKGADFNEPSNDGLSPLAIAAFWGYADIVKELIEYGADINSSNKGTLWTPLHCASFQGHGKVIMELMHHSPNVYTADYQGRTAIDFASALDSIWPFFHAAGCKRTPKSDLLRMDILKKGKEETLLIKTDFEISGPGSDYAMKNTNHKDNPCEKTMAYASVTGDVLAGTPDNRIEESRVPGPNLYWNAIK